MSTVRCSEAHGRQTPAFFFLFVLFSLPYLSHSDALVGPLRLESCFCHG